MGYNYIGLINSDHRRIKFSNKKLGLSEDWTKCSVAAQ